ncbi:MAG: HDOD domain-containing protein [Planctomycetota bacterium]|jgi:putative nucleotidyltransferase with HDIG domain
MAAGGDRTVAQQVELAVSGIEDLWLLPSVARRLLDILFNPKAPNVPSLSQIIESDACLCAKILSILDQHGKILSPDKPSIQAVTDKLASEILQDALLSIDLVDDLQIVQIGQNPTRPSKKDLAIHSCAVACAALAIAERIEQGPDEKLCYLAGLMHDIGKMALAKAMPKSFLMIAEQAMSKEASFCEIEQDHFGLDHAVLGQRLARKWRFPEPVMLAIWLHHSSPQIIAQRMPKVKIALVVQLADCLARQCGLGDSGSYEAVELAEDTLQSLQISEKDLDQIRQKLPDQVQQKCEMLGFDETQISAQFSKTAYQSVIHLASASSKLQAESRELRKTSGLFEFVKDFLTGIDKSCDFFGIAQRFVVCWQRHYHTGPVCLYIDGPTEDDKLLALIAETLSETKISYLEKPEDTTAVPNLISNKFDIVKAHDHLEWLFNQLNVEFDYQQTRLLPLISGQQAMGALIFEIRYPADIDMFRDTFRTSASIGASVLDKAATAYRQQQYAESFAQLLSIKQQPQQQKAESSGVLEALAEMAAGAAHELNNPLSVISGRIQLLEQSETDEEKKKTLKQVNENAEEITRIIDDLLGFAEPAHPRPETTTVQQVLDEATQLAALRAGLDEIDIEMNIEPDAKEVFVDSAQVVSSLANIFSNALESYAKEQGSVEVKVSSQQAGTFIAFEITDHGCGMDALTLSRAAHPFFSSKTAGRKRGMGLAYAKRLIELNGGKIKIESQPGIGTTVTIELPNRRI